MLQVFAWRGGCQIMPVIISYKDGVVLLRGSQKTPKTSLIHTSLHLISLKLSPKNLKNWTKFLWYKFTLRLNSNSRTLHPHARPNLSVLWPRSRQRLTKWLGFLLFFGEEKVRSGFESEHDQAQDGIAHRFLPSGYFCLIFLRWRHASSKQLSV